MTQVSLVFPGGSAHNFDAVLTGLALAESISKSLAKKASADALDGEAGDLCGPIGAFGAMEISVAICRHAQNTPMTSLPGMGFGRAAPEILAARLRWYL